MKVRSWLIRFLSLILFVLLYYLLVFYIFRDYFFGFGRQSIEYTVFMVLDHMLLIGFLVVVVNGLFLLYKYFRLKEKKLLFLSLRYLFVLPLIFFLVYLIVVKIEEVVTPKWTSCYIIGNVSYEKIEDKNLLAKYKNNLPADVVEKINRG